MELELLHVSMRAIVQYVTTVTVVIGNTEKNEEANSVLSDHSVILLGSIQSINCMMSILIK